MKLRGQKISRLAKMIIATGVLVVGVIGASAIRAEADAVAINESTVMKSEYADYVNILYNSENGLPTSEANDILQSPDGFIWVASYSGLIRYDGVAFKRISGENAVSSANTLFIDSKDRLWVGTNDNGAVLYENGNYTVINRDNGLQSNSVRAIEEDSNGNLYVGTSAGVSYIDPQTYEVHQITDERVKDAYITSMEMMADDTVICVNNTNQVFTIKGDEVSELLYQQAPIEKIISAYTVPGENRWFLGTEENYIYECQGTIDRFEMKKLFCGTLERVNEIKYISDGTLWVCADNGIGYFDQNEKLHILSEFPINNSVDNMIEDYEGNLWFSSARQGVFKCTKNYFVDSFKKADAAQAVVNGIVKYDGMLYVATDTGLVILDGTTQVENALTKKLSGVRIRNLMVDQSNQLWLSTYGDTGLVCFDGEKITSISEEQGIDSLKVRSSMQGTDGAIYAATANGIFIINNGEVTGQIGTKEGLTNLEVLSLCNGEGGKIYVGTDGGGVCVVENGKVVDCISEEDGMRSGIVMRVRHDVSNGGYWFVTSNSLVYYKDGEVRTIDKFPYSNNYDLYFGQQDSLWVLSSNGIYVTTVESMLDEQPLIYTFFDYNCGMPSAPTSNSFSYEDETENMLYVCGGKGAYCIEMQLDTDTKDSMTKLAVPDVVADGETYWTQNDTVTVPSDTKRIHVDAYVLNYGLENPMVTYALEGFDDGVFRARQSDFGDVDYTNLPGGTYTFRISVIDPVTGVALNDKTITLVKEKKLTEHVGFAILIAIILCVLLAGLMYLIMRLIMNRQLMAKEEAQNQALTDALEMARSASNAKGDFLSRMSHEIRTPLNAVIGYMDIAKRAKDNPEKLMHCVENTSVAARHLLDIINNVLDMSSIESGRMKVAHEEFDLRTEISEITTLFYNQAKEKKIHFDVSLRGITEEWVIGDGLRLKQVLLNLLSNAIKFTPEDGHIVLTITQKEMDAHQVAFEFAVSDDGIGMSEEYKQRLFQPFEQESAMTAKKYGGTGLGLSISNNLIHMMGGTIEVDSEQGKGTSFLVSLNFDRSYEKHETKEQTEVDYSKIRVLVVDDDEGSRTQISETLTRCDVKNDAVSDAKSAIRQLMRRKGTEFSYQMCIIDWNMPEVLGTDLTKEIREKYDPKMPIIIATSYDVGECEEEAKAAGVDRVIAKPLFQSSIVDLLVSVYGKYGQKTAAEPKIRDLAGVKVLLAEDNAMNMEIAVDILQKAGVKVETAMDGKQVIDTFTQTDAGTFDAILMDVQMPICDGYQATEIIRHSSHPEATTIPIIAMTANAFAEDVSAALAAGMTAHISKPIDQNKLYEALTKVKMEKAEKSL